MLTSVTRLAPAVMAGSFILVAAVLAAARDGPKDQPKPDVVLTPVRAPGNVFGGREAEVRFRVEARRAVRGRVAWRLAAGTATVAVGEGELAAAPGAPGVVTLKLPVPPVRDGVVLPTRLTVSAVEAGKAGPVAAHGQDIWVFPADPFAGRSAWLKKLKLSLYDPPGATAKVLTAAGVPFEPLRDVDAAAGLRGGVLVVGEGVSFREERGLAETLDRLAAAGVVVLCLAPADGELVIPGLGGPGGGQQDLTFRRDIVRALDRRLDPGGWGADGKIVASTVAVKPGDGGVVGAVAPDGGWPWVEARYGPGAGRWAVCGYAVIARWDDSPTPRFLFVRVLDYLTDPKSELPRIEPKREGDR